MAETRRRGVFISLEGGEGSGKSTMARVIAARLRQRTRDVCLTQEPGGTSTGRMIQAIFERHEPDAALTPLAELLLFAADRAQHVSEKIIPALQSGHIVISDRFADSTLAYQGYGRGLPLDLIRKLNDAATGGLRSDLTLLLDVPPETGLARAPDQIDATGREPLDFHRRVRDGFLQLAQEEPERIVVINATLPPDEVTQSCLAAIERLL